MTTKSKFIEIVPEHQYMQLILSLFKTTNKLFH